LLLHQSDTRCGGFWPWVWLAIVLLTPAEGAHARQRAIVWGVQPASGKIVTVSPTTGKISGSFAAPAELDPEDELIGLSIAEGGRTLIYRNQDTESTLYRLDPDSGAVLSRESAEPFSTDGLSFQSGSNDFVFYSHKNIDLHRQADFSGPEEFSWAAGEPVGGLGGDDNGRQFGYFADGSIHEYAPFTDTDGFISTLPAPADDIQGMAFDGVSLYASTASGDLYTLNPDTGAVLSKVSVTGGALFGLGARLDKMPGEGDGSGNGGNTGSGGGNNHGSEGSLACNAKRGIKVDRAEAAVRHGNSVAIATAKGHVRACVKVGRHRAGAFVGCSRSQHSTKGTLTCTAERGVTVGPDNVAVRHGGHAAVASAKTGTGAGSKARYLPRRDIRRKT
jgi:hypothetical protein